MVTKRQQIKKNKKAIMLLDSWEEEAAAQAKEHAQAIAEAEERGAREMIELLTCDCEECAGQKQHQIDSHMKLWRESRPGQKIVAEQVGTWKQKP